MDRQTETEAPERILQTRLLRLNALAQGLGAGLLFGLAVFVATNWLILKGGPVVGPNLALLGQFFIGYRVTFVGSLIGAGWGFAVGFAGGYGFARLYNSIARVRERGR